MGLGQAPLVGEPPGVVVEQPLGVDAVADESPAAEVVDEQIVSNRQVEARAAGALSEVVIVEEPEPEPLVEPPDLLVDGPLHEQTAPG